MEAWYNEGRGEARTMEDKWEERQDMEFKNCQNPHEEIDHYKAILTKVRECIRGIDTIENDLYDGEPIKNFRININYGEHGHYYLNINIEDDAFQWMIFDLLIDYFKTQINNLVKE